jgi:sugar diacid utilization regulator
VVALPELSAFDYVVASAPETARRLVDPAVREFLAEDRGVFKDTIRALADADLVLNVAAERLRIHPNTAKYRLSRIEERTGRNPRRVGDLFELLVAIALTE